MRNAVVRFAALYVFNLGVLLVIGWMLPQVSVGLHALWAAVVLSLAALTIKPVLRAAFLKSASKSASGRSRLAQKLLQYALIFVVELVVWFVTVWFSGVRASGFLGFVLPPLVLLFAWMIFDVVDDALRSKAGQAYDAVQARLSGGRRADAPATDSIAAEEGRAELRDGLTPEQRRMFDGL